MKRYEMRLDYRMKNRIELIPGLVDVFGNQKGLNTMKGISGSTRISEKQTNV